MAKEHDKIAYVVTARRKAKRGFEKTSKKCLTRAKRCDIIIKLSSREGSEKMDLEN